MSQSDKAREALIENAANELDQMFRQRHKHSDVTYLLGKLLESAQRPSTAALGHGPHPVGTVAVPPQAPLSSTAAPRADLDGVWVSRYFLRMIRTMASKIVGVEALKVSCEIDELLSIPVAPRSAIAEKDADMKRLEWLFSVLNDTEIKRKVTAVSDVHAGGSMHGIRMLDWRHSMDVAMQQYVAPVDGSGDAKP